MRFSDVFGMCVRNLVKRKLRTFLTMLGVIIGTTALVLTISMGLANEARFDRMVEGWDQDLAVINVYLVRWHTMGPDGNIIEPDYQEITDASIAEFSAIEGVLAASPIMRSWIVMRSGPYVTSMNAMGLSSQMLEAMNLDFRQGGVFSEDDEFGAIFGAHVELQFDYIDWERSVWRPGQLWDGTPYYEIERFIEVMEDEILFSYDWRLAWGGMEIQDIDDAFSPVRAFPLHVTGELAYMSDWDMDQTVIMSVESLQSLWLMQQESWREQDAEWGWFSAIQEPPREDYDNAIVRVHDVRDVSRVAAQIQEMGFRTSYRAEDIMRRQEQQQGTMTLLIGIAAVSIFVAAISIANTMIMSVYERTREIGVMKVIGGSIADIRKMFLLEAAMIGLLGGVFGVALSMGVSYAINNIDLAFLEGLDMMTDPTDPYDLTSLITPWLMGVALLFASFIGLFSGYFPARRATRLSALAAIRTD
jgi:cell division protein FtsX